jgi:hypothetical protein
MLDRLSRFAPLTGVAFAVLSGVTIVITPSSPSAHATGARVIAFYETHRGVERVSIILSVFALAFFMFFATSLRGYLGRTRSLEGLAALVLVAAGLLAVGLTVSGGFAYALADAPSRLAPATAQTLNLLDEDVFFAMVVGVGLFALASAFAILRGAWLPNWFGWLAIVIGVVSFTPAFGIALLALSIWVPIVSVVMFVRGRQPGGGVGEGAASIAASS